MIEGLRVAPAYYDARNEGAVVGSNGCAECKRTLPMQTRQALGCGYEPAIAGARPWAPAGWSGRGLDTTVCPGYSTSLPVVQEVTHVYAQWEQGTLADYLGEPPTDVALDCLMHFRAGIREHEADSIRARSQKGGPR